MKNRLYYLLIVAIGVVVVAVFWRERAGTSFDTGSNRENRVVIATTIFPLTDIARQVGGEMAEVVQLLPAGASPHAYNLTPQQLVELKDARILFMVGHGFDDWAARAVTGVGDIEVVVVDQDVTLLPFDAGHDHEGGDADPHYWLTVPNAQLIARNMTEQMVKLDGQNAEQYQKNLSAYITRLDELESELQITAGQLEQNSFMAIHDAWSYFAGQYGLELVATYEAQEGKQPSFEDLKAWEKIIEDNSLSVFYTEPQKKISGATNVLSEQFGLETRILDPIGGAQEDDSYIKLMRRNMEALAK